MLVTGTVSAPATTVTVGNGKAIHWGSDCGTKCGAAHRNGWFTKPQLVKADAVTCKRCIRLMAIQMEMDHEAALVDHQLVLDAEAVKTAGVEIGQTWVSQDEDVEAAEVTDITVGRLGALIYYVIKTGERTGVSCSLPLPLFLKFWALQNEEVLAAHLEALAEDAQRRDDAQRAEDLAAPSKSCPSAVALDTWLEPGLVLVGPSTDTLYVFENWTGGTAVLTSLATGAMEYVAQADITNWRYLPEAKLEVVPAAEVKEEDVVLFHAGGRYRTVESVERHTGTDLHSFSVLGNVVQFVRHAGEDVKRLVIPRG